MIYRFAVKSGETFYFLNLTQTTLRFFVIPWLKKEHPDKYTFCLGALTCLKTYPLQHAILPRQDYEIQTYKNKLNASNSSSNE